MSKRIAKSAVNGSKEPKSFRFSEVDREFWSKLTIKKWLEYKGFRQFADIFKERRIDGLKLCTTTQLDSIFQQIPDITNKEKENLFKEIEKEFPSQNFPDDEIGHVDDEPIYPHGRKVIQDCIHGNIELHPLLVKIVDTPQFQRLRDIKQLGCTSFVYPSACHTRFEHSIGVCHLAGEMVRKLQSKQPELEIMMRDILCVEVAGLCHDLGHGPFSHMFDENFLPMIQDSGKKWRHEGVSVTMFEHLLEENKSVRDAFRKYKLISGIPCIKELILGDSGKGPKKSPKKSFLYEVVANTKNGIDVDKWDYFARDCHYLGIKNAFDHMRMMSFVRVMSIDGKKQFCTRDKEAETLYEMFSTRRKLHKLAYQHRVCLAINSMLSDALYEAKDYLLFKDSEGKDIKISDCVNDPAAFTDLTDHIYYKIRASVDEKLQKARDILMRIERRQLYRFVGKTQKKDGGALKKSELLAMRKQIVQCLTVEGSIPLQSNDLVLNIINLDYGMGEKNPIEHVWFYTKGPEPKPMRMRREEVSKMLPEVFSEQYLIVHCKSLEEERIELAEKCLAKWCSDNEMVTPRTQTSLNMTQT